MSAVGIDDGAESRGIDRYEELTCEGENPRTTLVGLRATTPLVESEDVREDVGLETELSDLVADEESSLTSEATSAGGGVMRTGGEYG
jgi:hypothetical protein